MPTAPLKLYETTINFKRFISKFFDYNLNYSRLSIKNGKEILPIEDNCLRLQFCLRSVILNVRYAYGFCTILAFFLQFN